MAEFRAKKAKEDQRNERIQQIKGFFGFGKKNSAANKINDDDQLVINDEEESVWTWLDISILCVKLLLWCSLFLFAVHFEVGAVYVLTSGFAFIWLNLGSKGRKDGKLSAYSVFNKNFETIKGTLTADQFDNEIRHRNVVHK